VGHAASPFLFSSSFVFFPLSLRFFHFVRPDVLKISSLSAFRVDVCPLVRSSGLYSFDRMVDECGAVVGMRIGRGNKYSENVVQRTFQALSVTASTKC
jgi:hypothetical protein